MAVDLRFERLLEVAPFTARKLRGYVKGPPGTSRYANGDLRTLVSAQATKKSKVVSPLASGPKGVHGKTMIHGSEPVRLGQRHALVIRDRNEGCLGKAADER